MGESRIAGIGAGMLSQESGIDIVKRQEEAAEVMFADMLSMKGTADVKDFSADASDDMLATIENNKFSAKRESAADVYEKYQYKDKTIRAEKAELQTQDTDKITAEVEEFEEAITEVVAEELHVSKEELEAAMEKLGLTYLDLLDRANLANLVAKLTGSENLNQLLCNEAFTNVLVEVDTLGKELLTDLQMTIEELKAFQMNLQQLNSVRNGMDLDIDAEEDFGRTLKEADEKVSEVTLKEAAGVTLKDGSEQEVVDEIDSEEKAVRVEFVKDEEKNMSEESFSEGENDFAGNGKKMLQGQSVQVTEHAAIGNAQHVADFAQQLGEIETVQPLPQYVTVADIMEQFAEQTRVLLSADTSKIEMQLNPEHLGKLYVEVIEKEGSITAKIQTQNAVVKEALEMQIADLKMNLNQAGVKVDSVEVTIASHEFERNLEQDANSRKQQEDARAGSAKHRNINLNSLDELTGLMTEEETLVAKMMAEQGNRIDFSA